MPSVARRVTRKLQDATEQLVPAPPQASRGEQLLLAQQYRMLSRLGVPRPSFAETEFRNHSQNGEDGILLYLAVTCGMQLGRMVEIGGADGLECNSANLILNHGWQALLLDGDPQMIERGRAFYRVHPETRRVPPKMVHAWITAENVKGLLEEHGFAEGLDVLSIDVDGMDYWIAEALEPDATVVLVEYNNRLPADVAVAAPYAAEFVATGPRLDGEGFFGASLLAFKVLLGRFGYRLVGANSVNTNAFFLREGVAETELPEVSVESCLAAPWAVRQRERWWRALESREWAVVG